MKLTGRGCLAPGDDNVLTREPGIGLKRVMIRLAVPRAMAIERQPRHAG